ncbi:MAG TPA: lipoprotein [Xanthobacteraceae bacterium]
MARVRLRLSVTIAGVVVAALGLGACGRAGPLELPPGPATGQPTPSASLVAPGASTSAKDQELAAKTGFDRNGNPVAPQGPNKSFILDPLLQ